VVNFIPAFVSLDLPWVFTGWDHGIAVTQQPFIQEMFAEGYSRNLVPVALMPQGFRNVSNRLRPINVPQDIVGLRLRVVESPVFVSTFEAVGANVTAMAWGEVFTAMQQGAIDAAEMPYSQFYNERMFEIQSYYSLTEHMFAFGSLVVSKSLYDRLPADLRQLVREAANEALYVTGLEVRAQGDELARRIEARGVRVHPVADGTKAQFRQMVQPFYDRFLSTADPQVLRFVNYIEGMN
jgi:TRAP-type C4-dicarboxylate transport system substrate-binding protein